MPLIFCFFFPLTGTPTLIFAAASGAVISAMTAGLGHTLILVASFSSETPSPSAEIGFGTPPTGATSITVLGKSVAGSSQPSCRVLTGKTAAEASIWRSSTSVVGKAASSGSRQCCVLGVTSGGGIGSVTRMVTRLVCIFFFALPLS
jgi:hypothetical protein